MTGQQSNTGVKFHIIGTNGDGESCVVFFFEGVSVTALDG
jgi:ABC-type cobalamin transport system ATPase subunit